MRHARTTILALNLLLALLLQGDLEPASNESEPATLAASPVMVQASQVSTSVKPGIRIVTDRRSDLAGWALERYAVAGLELPDLDISIHRELDACKGNNGLYRNTGDRVEIHVCAPWPSRIERALLHELGHAWADATLTDEQRAVFLDQRGLEAWDGVAWEERGFEHAAEILMWGLAQDSFPLTSIADSDDETLTGAFELLTGIDPLNTPRHDDAAASSAPAGGQPLE